MDIFIERMRAVVTAGNGEYDKLYYKLVPTTPVPAAGELLVWVLAAGINNIEINTRLGCFSFVVIGSTDDLSTAQQDSGEREDDVGRNKATLIQTIQFIKICRCFLAAGPCADEMLFGKRVLVRAWMWVDWFACDSQCLDVFESDFNGALTQYGTVPARKVFPVECGWSDAALATIPFAYAAADTMLHRARCK